MYKIDVKSDFKELYRYNIIITCAGYDAESEVIYVVGEERIYSEDINTQVGITPPPPTNFTIGEMVTLECNDAESIFSTIYVVTNTLPQDRMVENSPPFDLEVTIYRDQDQIYKTTHEVNQWGGATINIKL